MSDHEGERPLTRREIRLREQELEAQNQASRPVQQQRESAYQQEQQRESVAPDLTYLEEAQARATKNWQTAETDAQAMLRSRREDSIFVTASRPVRPRLRPDLDQDREEPYIPEPSKSQSIADVIAHEGQTGEEPSDIWRAFEQEQKTESARAAAVEEAPRQSAARQKASTPSSIFDDAPPTEPFSIADLREAEKTQAAPEIAKPKYQSADDDVDTVSIPAHHLKMASQAAAKAEKALKDALKDQNESYSYPDVAPLDEKRSIFDQPAEPRGQVAPERPAEQRRNVSPAVPLPAPTPAPKVEPPSNLYGLNQEVNTSALDFDSVLERAIADENESGQSSNTSALILPSMPDIDLNAPIRETGEIFITGSLELPKSLSETGGLDRQLDRELDDDSGPLDIFSGYEKSDYDSRPKSATDAISSKKFQETLNTTPFTKDDEKKPLVLALIGGGLVLALVVAGVIIFSTGLLG